MPAPDSAPDIEISAIPAFNDNYIWLLENSEPSESRVCAVVDPGDAQPVMAALESRNLDLNYILLTHHHHDHAGGVEELLDSYPAVVFGPDDRRLGDWCQPCAEGDTVKLVKLGLEFKVLDIPAHTRSHVAFYGHGLLFSGDTLFSVGCGRLFEGSPLDMQRALDKLARLDPATRVYCGHEYTVSNAEFALEIEPHNNALQERLREAKAARASGEITLPSLLSRELAINPFMRTREPSVVAKAREIDASAEAGESTMAVIRAWKDRY